MQVNLTYFQKHNGEYYAKGSFDVDNNLDMDEICSIIKKMENEWELPGVNNFCLAECYVTENYTRFYIIHVDVPDHSNHCPALLFD